MPLCLCGDSASTYCLGRSTLTHLAVSRSLESWLWGVGGKKNQDERIESSLGCAEEFGVGRASLVLTEDAMLQITQP